MKSQIFKKQISFKELLEKANKLKGMSIGELAKIANIKVPDNLLKAKGWIGQLIEWHLGASASSKPMPDFPHLGIELKTIPINSNGTPKESTYICTAPLSPEYNDTWENSRVKEKLNKVLWIPIQSDKKIPINSRIIYNPIFWQMDDLTNETLKQDWEELTDMLYFGKVDQLSAKHGTYLHIRPKAKDSKTLETTVNQYGDIIKTVPKGFYLRTTFTKKIILNQNNT